jgi:hypothetical protein
MIASKRAPSIANTAKLTPADRAQAGGAHEAWRRYYPNSEAFVQFEFPSV